MAKKPISEEFAGDYFAYISREKRKRRRSAVVREERAAYQRAIDETFMAALAEFDDTTVVGSYYILDMAVGKGTFDLETLRMNMQKAMDRIGYARLINPESKDGRWKFCGVKFFVYRKKDAPIPTKNELKILFG